MTENPQDPATSLPATPADSDSLGRDVALVATFAAFLAVCALLPAIVLPGFAVPITLQTLGVMAAGTVLGTRRGFLAVVLYLAAGFVGLPVFAQGAAGVGVLGGPSAGYLMAFPFAAALAGWLTGKFARPGSPTQIPRIFAAAIISSLLIIHPIGITVMGWRLGMSAGEAIVTGAAFLPGDIIKNLVVAGLAAALFRAFPALLAERQK